MLSKRRIVEEILAHLETEMGALSAAARAARDAATHEESRAEDSHDTRGLEASYLAGAQAERAAALQRLIAVFKFLPTDAPVSERAAVGSLVEWESLGRRSRALLMAQGGGISVRVDGEPVQVVSVTSPLGEELVGRRVGDVFEIETQGREREYRVIALG